MKRLMLLVNPAAGKSAIGSKMIDLIDVFIKGGYEVECVISQSAEHLRQQVSDRAGDFDTIVCCGGDGTLSLTCAALLGVERAPRLGYIPCGTTNDFAKTRSISSDPIKAAKQIVKGEEHVIDVGYFGDRPYIYVAAFGAFSDVSYATSRSLKKAIGHAAYVLGGLKALLKIKSYHVKFNINGEVIEDDFIYGMVSNTMRVGGFKLPIFKKFELDDGLIDITLVRKPKGIKARSRLVNALIAQKSDGVELMQFRAQSFSYECEKEIPWTLDGEFGGAHKERTVKIVSGLITMLY